MRHGISQGWRKLAETNFFAPENGWLEYYIVSFWNGLFSGGGACIFTKIVAFIVELYINIEFT